MNEKDLRDIIAQVFTDFFELHGDRQLTDDEAIVGGIARFNDQAVTVIGIQKGRNLEENLATNFGQPSPNGYRKALRLMKQDSRIMSLPHINICVVLRCPKRRGLS